MIAVASTVVLFFKDEQHMVSKFNLLYVVYRAGQITVGRMILRCCSKNGHLSCEDCARHSRFPFRLFRGALRYELESYLEDFLAVFTRPSMLCNAAVKILESYPKPCRCLQEPHFPDTAGWSLAPHEQQERLQIGLSPSHAASCCPPPPSAARSPLAFQ